MVLDENLCEKSLKLKNRIIITLEVYLNEYWFISFNDKTIQILDPNTFEEIKMIKSKFIYHLLKCSKDYLFAASRNKIKIFDIESNFKKIGTIMEHEESISYLEIYNDFLLSYSYKNLYVNNIGYDFDLYIKKKIYISSYIYFEIYENILICACNDNNLKLFDMDDNFNFIDTKTKNLSNTKGIAIHNDDLLVYSDYLIKTFDIEDNYTFLGKDDFIIKIEKLKVFENLLICTSDNPFIYIFNIIDNYSIIKKLKWHNKNINNIIISSKYLISSSNDKIVNFFNLFLIKNLGNCRKKMGDSEFLMKLVLDLNNNILNNNEGINYINNSLENKLNINNIEGINNKFEKMENNMNKLENMIDYLKIENKKRKNANDILTEDYNKIKLENHILNEKLNKANINIEKLIKDNSSINKLDEANKNIDRLDKANENIEKLVEPYIIKQKLDEPNKSIEKLEDPNKSVEKLEKSNKSIEKIEESNKNIEKLEEPNKCIEEIENSNDSIEKLENNNDSIVKLENSNDSIIEI